MKLNGFIPVIITAVFLSCGTPPVKVINTSSGEISNLEKFFKRSELDAVKAGNVLEKHKIIQHLTHLRRMDTGGKKYYLLEKDDITEMINSVTEGVYLDYILINKNGEIIYTDKNDDIFGTNINRGYEATPLFKCFSNRTGVYMEDVSYISPASKMYSLYVSSPVYVEGNFHGVLILQIGISKISEIIENGTEILDRDGVIRVTSSEERMFSKYPAFDKIDLNLLNDNGVVLLNEKEGRLRFLKFNFKRIQWILAKHQI